MAIGKWSTFPISCLLKFLVYLSQNDLRFFVACSLAWRKLPRRERITLMDRSRQKHDEDVGQELWRHHPRRRSRQNPRLRLRRQQPSPRLCLRVQELQHRTPVGRERASRRSLKLMLLIVMVWLRRSRRKGSQRSPRGRRSRWRRKMLPLPLMALKNASLADEGLQQPSLWPSSMRSVKLSSKRWSHSWLLTVPTRTERYLMFLQLHVVHLLCWGWGGPVSHFAIWFHSI